MENFQLFIRIRGFWNTDVQLSPLKQPEFTHRKATTWPAQEIGSHSSAGLFMEDLDKENSLKQTALHWKIPCSLLKKILWQSCWLDWFCTNNLQVQVWESRRYWELCHQCLWPSPYDLEKALSEGAVRPACSPCFLSMATSRLCRCGWCEHITEMLQAARMFGRDVPAGFTAVLVDPLSARPAQRWLWENEWLSAYENTQKEQLQKQTTSYF